MGLLCMRKHIMEEMLSYIELNDEETGHDFVCDFICTIIRIIMFTILDFFSLVSYTPSFFLCCCDC